MSQYVFIEDICITDDFTRDFEHAPENIQNRMNTLIEMMLESNAFPASMHIRQSFKEDLWMGNVTQKRQAWRVLLWIDDDIITLHRLLTHDDRDRYLRI